MTVKSGLAILLAARAKPKKGEARASKDKKSPASEYADLVIEALQDDDAKGAAKALRRMVEACMHDAEPDDDDEDDEE